MVMKMTTLAKFMEAIEKVKYDYGDKIKHIYIDVYECITFVVEDNIGSQEVVINVNGTDDEECEIFIRRV